MSGAMETLLYSQTGNRDNRALIRPMETAWLSVEGMVLVEKHGKRQTAMCSRTLFVRKLITKHYAGEIWKRSFIFTVRFTVHPNPPRKRSFSKINALQTGGI